MPLSSKFTKEQRETASLLGISKNTLYRRLRQGWNAEKASSTPTLKYQNTPKRDERGMFATVCKETTEANEEGKIKKGFFLSEEDNSQLNQLVEKSGVTHSMYLENLVKEHLKESA